MSFINTSAYKFVHLPVDHLPILRVQMKEKAKSLELKGTILLSEEGINLFLSGTPEHLAAFKSYLEENKAFTGLPYKDSPSEKQPFSRMLVRIKKEIIAMGKPSVVPEKHTAPRISAKTFKQWYEEKKDMVVLDTRNDYEVMLGAFSGALKLDIKSFREFPEAVGRLKEALKGKPVITYCTGGIRCEKAAEWMLQEGIEEVYQLDGGILKYFEECGAAYYEGECFVFDKRVGVGPDLNETETVQCFDCRSPLRREQKALKTGCPYCGAPAERQG